MSGNAGYLNNRFWHIQFASGLVANLFTKYFYPFVPLYTTDENQLYVTDATGTPHPVGGSRIELYDTTADITADIPPGYAITDVFIFETSGNAVTGGIKIGTTAGGTEIATAITVGANSFTRTRDDQLNASGPFSPTAAQTIYVRAVTAWNSAHLDVVLDLKQGL